MGVCRILPIITTNERNKMFYILRVMTFSDRKEYDTDSGANKAYTKEDALKRVKALNLLNDSTFISYMIVQKAEGIVQGE